MLLALMDVAVNIYRLRNLIPHEISSIQWDNVGVVKIT